MAGKPYSERFVTFPGGGYSATYTVPAGTRIVLKSVVGFNGTGSAAQVVLVLNGNNIWSVSVPGSSGGVSPPFMLPLYAGERLQLYAGVVGLYCAVSGYRLVDPG